MSLNAKAAQFAVRCGARSATDITGVGLLGHGTQLARASNVTLELGIDTLPVLEGAPTFAEQGLLSAATYANRDYVGDFVRFDADVGLTWQDLLFDPQTSRSKRSRSTRRAFPCPLGLAMGLGAEGAKARRRLAHVLPSLASRRAPTVRNRRAVHGARRHRPRRRSRGRSVSGAFRFRVTTSKPRRPVVSDCVRHRGRAPVHPASVPAAALRRATAQEVVCVPTLTMTL